MTGIIGAVGAIIQGQQQAAMLEYQQEVAKQQGEQARREAAAKEAAIRHQAHLVRGQQEAGFAASGVSLEGSPLAALEDTAVQSELDALSPRYQGEAERWKQKAQARLYGAQATAARTKSYFDAGATLIQGTEQDALAVAKLMA